MPVKLSLVVVGALGTTPKKLKLRLRLINTETRTVELQKTTILNVQGSSI